MGGKGGQVNSACKSFSSDFAKHPEDYYSTTSCVNCHQSPPKIETLDPICDDYLPRPSPCTAEIRWPDYLQTSIRDIEHYPWWIDQNFLTAKIAKDTFPVTPKKLDIGIAIYIKSGEKIPISKTELELHTDDNSLMSSNLLFAGRGIDSYILLENQNLFTIQNVSAHLSGVLDLLIPRNTLETLSIKDGKLILTAAYGYRNLFRSRTNPLFTDKDLSDQIFPQLPVAYNEATGKNLNYEEFEALQPAEKRKHHRYELFYEAVRTKHFPERLRIQDLYQLFLDFQESSKIPKPQGSSSSGKAKDSKLNFADLVSSIWISGNIIPEEINHKKIYARFRDVPDSNAFQISLKTDGVKGIKSVEASSGLNLEELFLPDFLHLANTKGNFKLNVDTQGKTIASLNGISSDIKTMDYFKTSPRKLGLFELKEGTIQDGPSLAFSGIQFEPGIHLESQKPDEYSLQMNLNLNVKVKLPILGDVEIKGQLLFQTTLKKVEETEKDSFGETVKVTHFYLAPNSTLVAIPNLELKWGGLIPQTVQGNLLISDRSNSSNGTLLKPPSDGFFITFEAKDILLGSLQNGKVEMALPLTRTPEGLYDLGAFAKTPSLITSLLFNRKDKTQLKGKAELLTTSKGPQTDYRVDLSLDQLDEFGTKVIDPWVQNGLFTVTSRVKSDNSQSQEINFTADSLWLEPVDVGINKPKVRLFFTENRIENQLLDWTIHDFQISGNPNSGKFPNRGIFRGPFYLKTLTTPKKELVFLSDQNAHELKVKNLSLGFGFQRVTPPGIFKVTDGKITSIDVDGRVHGFWNMDTESYKGSGQIIFRGDKEGDLHVRDSRGKRIEARLNPNDPDRLYEVPLLADTTWTIDRIDGIDTAKERINGHFLLKTLIDYMVLQVMGISLNEHDEVTFEYDHQPYSTQGFNTKIGEFFQQIAEEQKKEAAKAKGATP